MIKTLRVVSKSKSLDESCELTDTPATNFVYDDQLKYMYPVNLEFFKWVSDSHVTFVGKNNNVKSFCFHYLPRMN